MWTKDLIVLSVCVSAAIDSHSALVEEREGEGKREKEGEGEGVRKKLQSLERTLKCPVHNIISHTLHLF